MITNPFEPIPANRLAPIFRWPPEALRFLDGEGGCLHVLGDAGMGKTALLLQIQRRLAEQDTVAPYTYLAPGADADINAIPLGPVTLLDETDRLDRRRLRALLARVHAGGFRVALGTHRSQLREAHRAGLSCLHLPLKPLARPEDVARVLEDRIALALGTSEHPFSLSLDAAEALLRLSRGNIERCIQLGYEVCEDIEAPREITADDIRAAAEALDHALQ